MSLIVKCVYLIECVLKVAVITLKNKPELN